MLPKNLKYGSKVESAAARSSRVNIAPQNGTGPYLPGDTIILNLPTRNNLVMVPTESYLKFTFTATSASDNNAFRWDSCGAHGAIQRIRVFHGSNLLSDVDSYGLLAKMMFDLQQPTDATYGKQNILAGTRSDLVTTFTAAPLINTCYSAYPINSGDRLLTAAGTEALMADTIKTQPVTYSLNLISLVGSLCAQNYLPLFAMSSAPLRVEIQLVSNLVNCCASLLGTTLNTFSITNCEYVMNAIELGDSAMQTIYSSLGGEPLQLVFPDFRNYQFSQALTTNLTQVTFPIPAKFSSLKALFVTMRDKFGISTFFPYSSVKTGLSEYTFRIGASVMPSKAPSTDAEFFAEVCKAAGSIGDITYQPSIDKRSYTQNASVAYTETGSTNMGSPISSGSFYIGLDCENYAGASKDTIFSGMNTNTDDIFAQLSVTSANALTVRFDGFANFDAVLVCENGTSYVKF